MRRQTTILRIVSVLAILAAWEWYGRHTNPILFSYPTAIAGAFVDMVRDGSLAKALGQSALALGGGFIGGVVLGIAIGVAMGRSAKASALLDVPVNALYATPMVALVPILVLWFGFGMTAKIVVVLLFTVFPVLINTERGVREVDPQLVEVTRAFCSSEPAAWRDLVLPSALPFILTGIRQAIGRALIGVVLAEFYTAISGLGYLIVSNANVFKTARVFVPVVVLMALGIALTTLFAWFETRLSPWRRPMTE